jgi:hypothetical protein
MVNALSAVSGVAANISIAEKFLVSQGQVSIDARFAPCHHHGIEIC